MIHVPRQKCPKFAARNRIQYLALFEGLLLILCALLGSAPRASAALGDLVTTFNLPANRMVVDSIRPRIYATLTGSNAVAVIDTSTLSVVSIIPIGSNPVGLAESADGSTLYVANSGSKVNGVGVIDLNTLTTLPSIATPEEPSDIAVGLNGWLYLTPADNDITICAVMQVSTTGTDQAQFGSEYVEGGAFLAISPDRKTLYYGDAGLSPATLASFDISTGTAAPLQEAGFASVGSNGEDLEISHSGAFLCFAVGSGQGDYSIAEIPTDNLNDSNGLFATGAYPSNIAFSPDDTLAYAAPVSQNQVRVFNTSTFVQTASFPAAGEIGRLTTDGAGRYLFATVLNLQNDPASISVYDTGRAPAITSSTTVTAGLDAAFSYQITATNSPTSFNATGLPAGLSVDPATGVISGTATAAGGSQVVISASNAIGITTADLTITVFSGEGLTVSVNGSGTVTSNLLGATYHAAGSHISITATPSPGYVFNGWTGDIISSSGTLAFNLNSPISIQANFVPGPPAVTSTTLGALVATFNLAANRLAVDSIRPRIYASLTGSNAVAVIDTSTLTLIKVIPIGSNPVGLAESADGNTLYVANSGSTTNGIGVIDLNTLTTLPSIGTPEPPSDIVVGLNGWLYLTPAGNDILVGAVMQVSTSGSAQLQFGNEYVEGGAFLAISPDRKTLYYGDSGLSPATLASFDVSTGTAAPLDEAAFGTVGSNGQDLEISHSGGFFCFAVGSGQGDYSISEYPVGRSRRQLWIIRYRRLSLEHWIQPG